MSESARVCEGSRLRSKAFELGRGERVDRRDLVDDEHAPAGDDDARELGDHQLGPRDVVQRPQRADEVERAELEGQLRRVALDERHVREPLRALPRLLEELRDDVDADDLAHVRRERERQRAGAAARVERPLVP